MVLVKLCPVVEGIYSLRYKASRIFFDYKSRCVEIIRQSLKSDFIFQIGETFVTRVLLILIGLITTVVVARVLGPEGRGLYAVATTFGTMGVQFANLGFHSSNTFYVSRDRSMLPALAGNSLVMSFLFGGLVVGLAWLGFYIWPRLAPLNGTLLILTLMWVPFGLAYLLIQNLLLGIQKIRAYNLVEFAGKVLGLAILGAFIVFKRFDVESVFFTALVTQIFGAICVFVLIYRDSESNLVPSVSVFKNTVNYGLGAYLAAFFSFIMLKMSLLMVKYMLGAEQAGFYSIAITMADLLYMLPVVVGTILFPKLSAKTNSEEKWDFTRKTIVVLVGVVLLIAVPAVAFSSPVVMLLFGHEFMPSIPVFIVLVPGILFLSVASILQNFLGAMGKASSMIYSPLGAMVITFAANLVLIKKMGILGASVASVIGYLSFMIIATVISKKRLIQEMGIIYAKSE